MDTSKIPVGKDAPWDINVVIEIPSGSNVKYEVDKDSGAVVVDRILFTPMYYPCNYGFVPNTLGDDGDPVDVLVVGQDPVQAGSVIRARPVGVLKMSDEGGQDEKIVAVPHDKVTTFYTDVKSCSDLPKLLIDQIQHFFERYKDLEPGKWVKVDEWADAETAAAILQKGVDAYKG